MVKPAWEEPVTCAKLIDLSSGLVCCCGEASPTFGLCGKSKSTSQLGAEPTRRRYQIGGAQFAVEEDYNSVLAVCRIEGSLSSCLDSGVATGIFLTSIVFDPRGTE